MHLIIAYLGLTRWRETQRKCKNPCDLSIMENSWWRRGSSAWNRLTVDITVKITINKSKLDIRTMHITLQIRSAKSYYCVYFAVSCSFLVKWRTLMHRMHKQSSQMCCCFSHQHERNAWHIGRDNGVRFRLPLILKKKKKIHSFCQIGRPISFQLHIRKVSSRLFFMLKSCFVLINYMTAVLSKKIYAALKKYAFWRIANLPFFPCGVCQMLSGISCATIWH